MTPVSHTLINALAAAGKEVYVPDQFHGRSFSAPVQAIAQRFVTARLHGEPLAAFPGPLPKDLTEAYECQEAAIELWPDAIAGWKVGLIGPELATLFNQDRLAGPIFSASVSWSSPGVRSPFAVFTDGFAAVEAEFVLRLGSDAPRDKVTWTHDEAFAMVESVHCAVETAGSPLATINSLGPRAIVADFGNNAGLIMGPALDQWGARSPQHWRCESFIDGVSAGRGHGAVSPGGPFESLRFLLALNARRGRPLKRGDLVSTGAVTGVHEIRAGQSAQVVFADAGEIMCVAEPFIPAVHSGARSGAP
jgi:2-keto-4-pentenoate hydratase